MIYYKEKRTPFHLFHRNLNLIRLFVHRHINNAEIHSCNLNKNNIQVITCSPLWPSVLYFKRLL